MNLDLATGQSIGNAFGRHWDVVYKLGQDEGIDQVLLDAACAALTAVKVAFDAKLGGNVTPDAGGQRK